MFLKVRSRYALFISYLSILMLLMSTRAFAGMISNDSLEHNKLTRTYRLYIPWKTIPQKPVPLVLVLHGGLGNGNRIAAQTHFDTLADAEGFLVVYPEAIDRHWNDGRKDPQANPEHAKVDDVGYIALLMDKLSVKFPIDKHRIYAVGVSNGGMMCHRLAFQLPDRLAAVGAVSASIPEDLTPVSMPDITVPIILFNGTADPLILWNGGTVARDRGKVIPVKDTVDFWVKHNKCNPTPTTTRIPDSNPDDHTQVWRDTYADTSGNPLVVFYGIQEGGHHWPGGGTGQKVLNLGYVNRDINATTLVWDFFKTHTK